MDNELLQEIGRKVDGHDELLQEIGMKVGCLHQFMWVVITLWLLGVLLGGCWAFLR